MGKDQSNLVKMGSMFWLDWSNMVKAKANASGFCFLLKE